MIAVNSYWLKSESGSSRVWVEMRRQLIMVATPARIQVPLLRSSWERDLHHQQDSSEYNSSKSPDQTSPVAERAASAVPACT